MYCYVCKRNPLLTYGSDWSPEDFYQPKFATGGVVRGKPFIFERDVTIVPNFHSSYTTVIAGKWEVPSIEQFKNEMEEFEKMVNKIDTRTMKTEKPSYEELASALKETDQFWKDMLNGKKHASEEITRAMANECILKKLVPVEEELTIRDCMDPVTTFDKRGSIVPATYRDSMINYPTKAIAEKVLLYGLLQSVAHKLNGGKSDPTWWIYLYRGEFKTTTLPCSLDPLFKSEELAKQAISIFAKSKFDLKKLYQ
jgi:hypothetical protein